MQSLKRMKSFSKVDLINSLKLNLVTLLTVTIVRIVNCISVEGLLFFLASKY